MKVQVNVMEILHELSEHPDVVQWCADDYHLKETAEYEDNSGIRYRKLDRLRIGETVYSFDQFVVGLVSMQAADDLTKKELQWIEQNPYKAPKCFMDVLDHQWQKLCLYCLDNVMTLY